MEYANSNYMQIGNILQMLNDLNDTHVFKDKLTLVSLRDYKLAYTLGRKVENVFFEEVEDQGALAIGELTGSKKLKKWEFLPCFLGILMLTLLGF